MNRDVIKGKWLRVKGIIRERWGKLTDSDLAQIEGNLEQAAGRLQERYGMAREHAVREWGEFCARVTDLLDKQSSGKRREDDEEETPV